MREINTYTVAQAGMKLGLSYNQVLRLVLVGQLQGEQRDGRWQLEKAGVDAMVAERARGTAALARV